MKYTLLLYIFLGACALEDVDADAPDVGAPSTNEVAQSIVQVQDVPRHIAVSHDSQCFLDMKTNGPNLWCWGNNVVGEVGDNTTAPVFVPKLIGSNNYTQISAGYHHFCALSNSGQLYCWGWNANGQLGLGDTTDRRVPTYVGTTPGYIDGWRSITSGWKHTCGLRTVTSEDAYGNAQMWCWGRNTEGALGLGDTTDRAIPTPLVYWATNVEAGAYHTCTAARVQNVAFPTKNIRCTGWNGNGQLGDKTTTNRLNLTPIVGANGAAVGSLRVSRISHGGYGHTCVIIGSTASNAGGLYCWGLNLHGQSGLPSTTTQINYFDAFERCDVSSGLSSAPAPSCGGFLEVSAGYTSTSVVRVTQYQGRPLQNYFKGMGQDAYNALAFYGNTLAPGLGWWFQYGGVAHSSVPLVGPYPYVGQALEVATDWNRSCRIVGATSPNRVQYSCSGPDVPGDIPMPFGSTAWEAFVNADVVKTITF